MSTPNNIKLLLNIQDINIIFEDESVKEGQYKRKPCKYIGGKLSNVCSLKIHHQRHLTKNQ